MLSRRHIKTMLCAIIAVIGVYSLILTWQKQDQSRYIDQLKAVHFQNKSVHDFPSRAMRQGFIKQWPAVFEDLGLEDGTMGKHEVIIVYTWCTDYDSEQFVVSESRDIHTVHDTLTRFQCALAYRYLMATKQEDQYK